MIDSIPCIGGPLDGNSFTPGGDRRACPLGYLPTEFQGMQFFVDETMGPLAARREMRRLYAAQQSVAFASQPWLDMIEGKARDLVAQAERLGVVLTITQRPLQPLGMAHYETVVEVRPVQVPT